MIEGHYYHLEISPANGGKRGIKKKMKGGFAAGPSAEA